MLTRAGWALAAGSVAAAAVGRLLGVPELFVAAAVAWGLLLAALVRARPGAPPVDVRRVIHPPLVSIGGQARVDLLVTNRRSRRSPVLVLRDPVGGHAGASVAVAPLAGDAVESARYRVPAERRGVLPVGPLEAELTDVFGLARRRWTLAAVDTVTVLPRLETLTGRVRGGGLDDPMAGVTRPILGGRGEDDFSGLRPYVVGDDLRRIHWATSAHTDELVVRQDDPPWQGHLTVLLDGRDFRIDADAFEVAVSAAASLLHAAADRGDRARLVISDGTDSGLVDARSAHDTLLEHLAVVERHPAGILAEPPADRRARSGGLVAVMGTIGEREAALLAAQRTRFASVVVVLIGGAAATPLARGVVLVSVPTGASFAEAWSRRGNRPAGARS